MLKLHFKDGRQAPIWLVEERFSIGEDRRNQLVLAEPGIGAFHAEIIQRDGHYFLSDCDSAGGTFVNGQRITTQYQLRPEDQLRIGSVELLLLDPGKAVVRPDATVRWYLQVNSGEQVGKKFHLQPGSLGVGRSSKCELCFGDPELSRRHGEFFLKDDVLEVKDLASANGVYVNRQKVDTAVLTPGDEVRMGSVTLLVIGPKVGARAHEEAEEDEDATQFMKAVDLPKADKPQTAGRAPTANPLRAAAQAEAAAPPAAKADANLLKLALLAGGLLVAAAAAGVLLVR
ncbi:FHA domain-containing protein [Pseudomonas sp. MAP12]|uniref:FHA domain-containing protein n=1 Tax=Geopseudomonas aromaticivorans TaxID=2849492 RepID=A0ABS6N0W9_9GAMM|nr:FHA domain-containing protein [Pseudomonas aromaticivorans]MBV2134697.1 FHA domain-containing protein [Pseudomonas aromaticivorans]